MRHEAKSCGAFRGPHSGLAERPRIHGHGHRDSWDRPGEPRAQWIRGSLSGVAMRHAIPPTLRKETPHSTGSQAAMTHEEHKVVT